MRRPVAANSCAATMSFAMIFPGQGSQVPRHGGERSQRPETVAAEVFAEVDDAFGGKSVDDHLGGFLPKT